MPFVFPHFIMAAIPHVKCDIGSGRENLLLEKQSQMHNNDFNMKYDITVMLFCLDMFAFEASNFYLWCASVI